MGSGPASTWPQHHSMQVGLHDQIYLYWMHMRQFDIGTTYLNNDLTTKI